MSLSTEQPDPSRRGLQPPQFGLRTLFLAITALCGLLVVLKTVGPLWAFAMTMLLLLIAAHVIGNAIGTRLRDGGPAITERNISLGTGDDAAGGEYSPAMSVGRPASAQVRNWQPPTATRLQEKCPLGWVVLSIVLVGALVGGALGGGAIASLYWDRLRFAPLAIGSTASGIIGAIFALGASTFWNTVHRAWRQAATEAAGDHRRSREGQPHA